MYKEGWKIDKHDTRHRDRVNFLNRANSGGGKFYRRPCILLITHTPCAAWPDGRGSIIHRSQSRSSVFIRLTINVTGRGLKMHQPFTRSYDEGAIRDLGRFRRVLNDHFCRVGGEREGRGIVKYNGH